MTHSLPTMLLAFVVALPLATGACAAKDGSSTDQGEGDGTKTFIFTVDVVDGQPVVDDVDVDIEKELDARRDLCHLDSG